MKRPVQRSLFRAPPRPASPSRIRVDTKHEIAEFEFTGEGCEPDPTWTPPEFLRVPTDDPEWLPEVKRK